MTKTIAYTTVSISKSPTVLFLPMLIPYAPLDEYMCGSDRYNTSAISQSETFVVIITAPIKNIAIIEPKNKMYASLLVL